MSIKHNVTERRFKCPCCNYVYTAYKNSARRTKQGHLKKLYCCTCKKETNHAEVSGYAYTYEDFLLEFKYGHFTKEGKRLAFIDLKFCKNTDCPFGCFYHGRCWDARKHECKERK